jgi:hypothetical protein
MRLNHRIKRAGTLLIVSLAAACVSAQGTFTYKALINKVAEDGFYKISLRPEVVAKSKADLPDIRITDLKGNAVPYITMGALPRMEKQKFIIFPQMARASAKDTGTTLIIENPLKRPVRTLWLKLNNTAVQRTVNLTGSDDLQQWYAIEENTPLRDAVADSLGASVQSLSFPACSYRYIKLLVNDRNKAPLKFLQAGVYLQNSSDTAGFNWPVPSPQITKKDSGNISYVTLVFAGNYQINSLHFNISAPKFYKRDVAVFEVNGQSREFMGSAELNSNKPLNIALSVKTSKLELQITNNDDLPLQIDSVTAYQADEYIVSYLEKGHSYQLLTGNSLAATPEYDLRFFADSIKNIQPIGIGPPVVISQATASASKSNYSVFIWIAIVVALVLLSLLTAKMVQEVSKKSGSK